MYAFRARQKCSRMLRHDDGKLLICHGIVSFQCHFKKMKLFERRDFLETMKINASFWDSRTVTGLALENQTDP